MLQEKREREREIRGTRERERIENREWRIENREFVTANPKMKKKKMKEKE